VAGLSKKIMNNVVGVTMVESESAPERILAARPLRRLLLASLTIAAILLGLLGMHALSAGTDAQGSHGTHSPMLSVLDTGPQMMSGSSESAPLLIASAFATSIRVASAQTSTNMSATNCLLLGMVCALGFLVVVFVLVVSKRPSPLLSGIRRVTRIPRIATSKFVAPTTPSLYALSISRT
jgi:hypothetical protein